MSKRPAAEALGELAVPSPVSKRSRTEEPVTPEDTLQARRNGRTTTTQGDEDEDEDAVANGVQDVSINGGRGGGEDNDDDSDDDNNNKGDDDDEDAGLDEAPVKAPTRQAGPADGYDDLYLDTIDRNVLDFDFEKLCSVSLSNINVYACLVCGRYYQGRGVRSHAYFHSVDEDHHVFINLETQKVYVLPDGYEVKSKSLDDIKYVSDPRYTTREVMELDRSKKADQDHQNHRHRDDPKESRQRHDPDRNHHRSWTLDGKPYVPGFVGMNNIKENDYLNVIVQALSHVPPLRNFFLLEDLSGKSELVKRCGILFRKIWNPRAFKSHVSPHELLQEIALLSNKRFTLTHQSDPVEFLSWFLNNLHLGLGGSKSRPGSSAVQRFFQGRLRVESQAITRRADAGDRLRFEEAAEVKVDVVRFMLLTLDLPSAPLFQDELERNIIPQVPLSAVLAKYDGQRAQEHHAQRKRYRLLHPLPPFLIFHVKRFSQNKFVSERNPTIVTFEPRNLDVSPLVEPDPDEWPLGEPIWYDLVANVVHEAVRSRDDVADSGEERKTWKVQIKDKATGEWVVSQDLYVDKVQSELLYLGETYLQIWERRGGGKKRKDKGKAKA